jgi:hypothetical protein
MEAAVEYTLGLDPPPSDTAADACVEGVSAEGSDGSPAEGRGAWQRQYVPFVDGDQLVGRAILGVEDMEMQCVGFAWMAEEAWDAAVARVSEAPPAVAALCYGNAMWLRGIQDAAHAPVSAPAPAAQGTMPVATFPPPDDDDSRDATQDPQGATAAALPRPAEEGAAERSSDRGGSVSDAPTAAGSGASEVEHYAKMASALRAVATAAVDGDGAANGHVSRLTQNLTEGDGAPVANLNVATGPVDHDMRVRFGQALRALAEVARAEGCPEAAQEQTAIAEAWEAGDVERARNMMRDTLMIAQASATLRETLRAADSRGSGGDGRANGISVAGGATVASGAAPSTPPAAGGPAEAAGGHDDDTPATARATAASRSSDTPPAADESASPQAGDAARKAPADGTCSGAPSAPADGAPEQVPSAEMLRLAAISLAGRGPAPPPTGEERKLASLLSEHPEQARSEAAVSGEGGDKRPRATTQDDSAARSGLGGVYGPLIGSGASLSLAESGVGSDEPPPTEQEAMLLKRLLESPGLRHAALRSSAEDKAGFEKQALASLRASMRANRAEPQQGPSQGSEAVAAAVGGGGGANEAEVQVYSPDKWMGFPGDSLPDKGLEKSLAQLDVGTAAAQAAAATGLLLQGLGDSTISQVQNLSPCTPIRNRFCSNSLAVRSQRASARSDNHWFSRLVCLG